MDKHYPIKDGRLLCGEQPNPKTRNWTGSPIRVTCRECVVLLHDKRIVVKPAF